MLMAIAKASFIRVNDSEHEHADRNVLLCKKRKRLEFMAYGKTTIKPKADALARQSLQTNSETE